MFQQEFFAYILDTGGKKKKAVGLRADLSALPASVDSDDRIAGVSERLGSDRLSDIWSDQGRARGSRR